jgi:hypothetical protein
VTKRKGDFRSKIDSILAEGDGGAAPVGLATPTDETRTDSIEIGKIFLPKGRRPDQDVSELLSSVKRKGVLQPLLLRPVGSRYEVVDGARRLVAAQQTGRTSVPAVVRKLSAAEAKAAASRDRPIVAPSRAAARTVTASKAKAVRKATGKVPAKPPVRALADAAAASAAPKAKAASPKAPAKPVVGKAGGAAKKSSTRTGAARRPARRPAAAPPASPAPVLQVFDEAPPAPLPPIAVEPAPPMVVEAPPVELDRGLVAAARDAQSVESRAAASFRARPEQAAEPAAGRESSPDASGVLSLSGRRPSRTRAMAGWYLFLAVLFAASFALANLAINHEASLSLATGGLAGVGLIAVVVILATGR